MTEEEEAYILGEKYRERVNMTQVRRTLQRRAIQRVFRESVRPLSVQEILELAKDYVPTIGIATVYRDVKRLTEEDWLHVVELPGEVTRYERSNLDHHHHFSCQKCKRVFDIHDCPENFESLLPKGFVLDSHEIILYGTCANCTN